ncbi:tRNA1(Val) (adenine(37)-N6)-methyltransferase [Fundidesulfovibrio terrae]|uniref:tRNA1(Val) (adenine(37)-N6)-methyltransferase n=1 Tax=Fundidesulfovibrio terrae TaxID=2922866 RepID=UPI001FAFAB17|nr:methyltransferase [Fundidesulfovibrio terrae]
MAPPSDQEVAAARAAFPTGLLQPEGGYRFSLDPLLLAVFARPKKNARMADLGTGCGVAALAALLAHPAASTALGLDVAPAMARAATSNAASLGISDRFAALNLDIRCVRDARPDLEPESFGLVLANPPYRRLGTGQPCPGEERNRARFETGAGLEDFLAAAAWLLANRGALAIVFPAARLPELLCGCVAARLSPKRLRMVHSRLEEPARLVLLEAVKNAGAELAVEPPLVLYEGYGENTRMTEAALAYCPFLARNP